jgi:succinoglycan biosynthesis transport protein ExoP
MANIQKSHADENLARVHKIESVAGSEKNDDFIQRAYLQDYLEILARRKWIFISIFISIVGIVALVSVFISSRYEAVVRILIGMQPTLMNPVGENSVHDPERGLYFQTQVNLLASRSLAIKVIGDIGLDKVSTMAASSQSSMSFAVVKQSQQSNASKWGNAESRNKEYLPNGKLLKWYLKHLKVTPIKDSCLVDISFRGTNPVLITQIINKHANAAIEYAVQQHQNQAKEAHDWLRKQIDDQKKVVENTQMEIYKFKKKYNVLTIEDQQTNFSKDFQELNNSFSRAKSERISKEAAYRQLLNIAKHKKDVLLIPEIANYSIVQNMRNQLADLMYKKIEMNSKYGPKHPKMKEINDGIQQLKNQIATEIDRLEMAMAADVDRAKAIENSIAAVLNKQKEIALSMREKSIEYEVLKQQADSAKEIYDFLLKQSEQLGLSSVISSSNMRIVDSAEIPLDPVSPKIYLNILIAVFLSLFIGTGLTFLVDYLDNTVKTIDDITNRLGLPILGLIPYQRVRHQKNGVTSFLKSLTGQKEKKSENNTLYHIASRLPEKLRSRTDGFYGRVLVVESITEGEGKSCVATRIASNLAESGQRVLLVDCDFHCPSLNELCNLSKDVLGLGHFIDLILSYKLSEGTLSEYSVDDLFFFIGLKRLSGHLMIKQEDQTFIAHFQHGVLLHIQHQNNPENNRIGTMLLNAGFINKTQLEDALNRHRRTGQPLGYILVNTGCIGRDKLRGPLRLQNEEYIQKIFSWKSGEFQFKHGMIRIYENEKIFFEEDYSALINNLGRIDISNFFEKELFSHIAQYNSDNLYLLLVGKSDKPISPFSPVVMEKVFEKLRLNFDVILVDAIPINETSGIQSTFSFADGIILVVKSGHLKLKTLKNGINQLPYEKIIGTVLNQAKFKTEDDYLNSQHI